MKRPFALSTKIFLLATGNVVLLGILFLIFFRLELKQDLGFQLMTVGRDHARVVAQQLAVRLKDVPETEWDSVLSGVSAANGVTFLIFDIGGRQIAGPSLPLPQSVHARLQPQLSKRYGLQPWVPPFIEIAQGERPYWLGVWLPVGQEIVRPDQVSRTILVLASSSLISNPFFFHLTPWLVLAGLAFAATVLCWLPLVRSLTRSIHQMMHATAEIAEGHFTAQVENRRRDELGNLSASINQMAGRLDMFTRAHKRFLGDVAHELRSPLARMYIALEILERKIEGKLGDKDSSIEDLREDVAAMTSLTDELLTFARAKFIPEQRNLQPIQLLEVALKCVRTDVKAGVEIKVSIDPALYVKAEPDYLQRSLSNLLRNAVRYAGDQGAVVVRAETDGEISIITVADSGPGIPEEALDKIFTPFFRLEEARDRKSGGTGLGLAIVKACVEACQGSVICRNRKPHGLEVVITLQTA